MKTLADVHLKLRAFTLAEYCYTRSGTRNADLSKCLIEQNNLAKCVEALKLIDEIEPQATDEEEKLNLVALKAKLVSMKW